MCTGQWVQSADSERSQLVQNLIHQDIVTVKFRGEGELTEPQELPGGLRKLALPSPNNNSVMSVVMDCSFSKFMAPSSACYNAESARRCRLHVPSCMTVDGELVYSVPVPEHLEETTWQVHR